MMQEVLEKMERQMQRSSAQLSSLQRRTSAPVVESC